MSVILDFVARYGVPVFPCKPDAKVPATSHGFHDASIDPVVINRWDAGGCNWGMPTGSRSFVVIDIDVRPEKDGNETMAALQKRYGKLPDTATVMTPSGGVHYWFKSIEQIQNSTEKLGPGVDVRGDGGYVVIPPSRIGGRPYQWEASSDPEDVGFAGLPGWLLELLKRPAKALAGNKMPNGRAISEGGRNAHLTRLAGSMRRPGMSVQAMTAALLEENSLRCNPPLTDDEVRIIARSVGRYQPEENSEERGKTCINAAPHYLSALESLHESGLPSGDKTGWPSVDKHYTVVPGQLTVITGWPGAGKSEWLDALLVNLARQGWRVAIFSPENKPTELHVSKLLEKITGKPFGRGPTDRLSRDELLEYVDDIREWFGFVEAETIASLDDVVEAVSPFFAKQATGTKRGLVIDPWNELEHWRPQGLSETEYVSLSLSKIRNWGRQHAVHVWIVAHPQKMRRDDGGRLPVPRPDMISGSQNWWNKADAAITVYRDPEKLGARETEIYVQKIRFKHVGSPGMIVLDYDRVTGRYHEPRQFAHIRGRVGDE